MVKTLIKKENDPLEFAGDVSFFSQSRGLRLMPIAVSKNSEVKTPDILMNGQRWEIKCPFVGKYHTLQHLFKKSVKNLTAKPCKSV